MQIQAVLSLPSLRVCQILECKDLRERDATLKCRGNFNLGQPCFVPTQLAVCYRFEGMLLCDVTPPSIHYKPIVHRQVIEVEGPLPGSPRILLRVNLLDAAIYLVEFFNQLLPGSIEMTFPDGVRSCFSPSITIMPRILQPQVLYPITRLPPNTRPAFGLLSRVLAD